MIVVRHFLIVMLCPECSLEQSQWSSSIHHQHGDERPKDTGGVRWRWRQSRGPERARQDQQLDTLGMKRFVIANLSLC